MSETVEHRLLRSIAGRPLEMATVICVLAVLWGGLVPFDFRASADQPIPTWATWQRSLDDAHLPDIAANVVLLLPVGLLARAALRRNRWSAIGSWMGAVLLGVGLSLLIETAQAFSPRRGSSIVDLVCNFVGAAAGASVYSLAAIIARAVLDAGGGTLAACGERWRAQPSALLARLWALGIALATLTPFDVTISIDRLADSIRDTTVIPFARASRLGDGLGGAAAGVTGGATNAIGNLWQLRLDYLWALVAYGVLAVLVCRYLARHCRVTGVRQIGLSVAACALLSVALSGAQMFIMSRSADVTYVLLAGIGALVGALLSDALWRSWSPSHTGGGPFAPRQRVRLVTYALAAGVLYVGARQLAPFDFDVSQAAIRAQFSTIEWVPLVAYQHAHLPIALDDLLHKLMRWSCVAVLFCMWRRHRGMSDTRQPVVRTALVAVAVVAAFEALQLLLPARNPSVTDLVVTAIATAGGVICYRLVATAMTLNGMLRPVETERILFNVELGDASEGPREREIAPRADAEA